MPPLLGLQSRPCIRADGGYILLIPLQIYDVYLEISNCLLPLLILATRHATCHNLSAQIADPSSPPFDFSSSLSCRFFFPLVVVVVVPFVPSCAAATRRDDNLHANEQHLLGRRERKLIDISCWRDELRTDGIASATSSSSSFFAGCRCFVFLSLESSYLRSSILTKRLNYPYDCARTPKPLRCATCFYIFPTREMKNKKRNENRFGKLTIIHPFHTEPLLVINFQERKNSCILQGTMLGAAASRISTV